MSVDIKNGVTVNGVAVPTISSTDTQSNKTFVSPTVTTGLSALDAPISAGSSTDVLGTALAVMRNAVRVGRIDNNGSGLRVQAETGTLQLRGTGNSGISVDSSGGAQVAGALTAEGRSVVTATTGAPKLTVSTTAPSSPATGDLWIDTN